MNTPALCAEKVRELTLTAASGLVAVGRWFWVVADDELHVVRFPRQGDGPEERLRVLPGALPADAKERKKRKPDLEALVALDGTRLMAVPSGSKGNRTVGALIGADGRAVRPVDFAGLYESLGRRGVSQLNVEGAVALDEELWLLHRGNSEGAVNLVIRLELAQVTAALTSAGTLRMPAACVVGMEEHALGAAGGVALTFTDGARAGEGQVVFTAVAEATDDAYLDGPCAGSAIGVLDVRTRKVVEIRALEGGQKAEGVHVERWPAIRTHNVCPDPDSGHTMCVPGEPGEREILVVTDDDDPTKRSGLYRIRW